MKKRVVILEFSRRRGKRKLFGETTTDGDVSHIWVDASQNMGEFINTLFHEFSHSVIHWLGHGIDARKEEDIARLVGNVVEPCFRIYKRGSTSEFRRTG